MSDRDRFFAVLGVLAEHQGFDVVQPSSTVQALDRLVVETARASHLGYRNVSLEGAWHRSDVGALLGTLDGSPVALIPRSSGRGYLVADAQSSRRLDGDTARRVGIDAYELYAPLPPGDLRVRDLARVALAGSRRTVGVLLGAAAMIGLLGLLTPVAVRHVFGSVIPAEETVLLVAMGLLLVAAAVVSGAFAVVEGFAVNRIALVAQKRLQPAIWHRVLSLPTSFFRRFPSGELTTRILGVNRLETLISASIVGVVLSAVFSMFNLGLILAFDPLLAAAALAVVVLAAVVTWRSTSRIVAVASDVVALARGNDAHFSDIIEGLTAIRVSGSEHVFYRRHLDMVSSKVAAQAVQQREANRLHLFYAGLVVGAPGLFFLLVGGLQWDAAAGSSSVSAVTFVAFMAAFNTVLGAFLAMGMLIQPLSVVGPIIDGLAPVLEAEPEPGADMPPPGVLLGRVELRHVSFRYPESRRQTLDDVGFIVEPGQFAALVGPSGAGKSTIVRLLLGFETPDRGSVLYDGQSLEDHDVSAIRSQLGVVLQEARVFAGSIRDNIVGARRATLDEVWEAVDNAGIGDDIRAMPMGLETIVSPDGSTFSGGQLQRLLIARALLVKPRILILDEATSSLDDVTQEIVTESVARLDVTRIVLAHRLSTIRTADVVLVLDDGRLVEHGTYDELVGAGGLFSRLVERQVA